ncbi:MAG: type II toxin-antitoxin system death-on-curing family toxin [Acidobacteriota bacterium]
MKEPVWIDESEVHAIHEQVLAEHGGASGLRDAKLLATALARPRQHFAYGAHPSVVEMAALYTAGIVKNHPFVDGNKRTGFVIGILFLELNGQRFTATEEDATQAVLDLAAGVMKESAFTEWFASQSRPIRKSR